MDRNFRIRAFFLPAFVLIVSVGNYSRLSGTENIRPIHIVTLITAGMALGILLLNLITFFRNKS